MKKHTAFTKAMVVAIALTTPFALSGCFANPLDQITDKITDEIGSEIAEGGAEELVEGITGGEFDIETGGELPDDFPAELPVVDGKVQSAIGSTVDGKKIWIMTFVVDDAAATMDELRGKFAAAGFEEGVWNKTEHMTTASVQSDTYIVTLSDMMSNEDEQLISYSVAEKAPSE